MLHLSGVEFLEIFAKHIKKIKVTDNDMKTPSIFKKNLKIHIEKS